MMVTTSPTIDACALSSVSLIALIGGGGKTTLMAAMARYLVCRGARVLVTTTTRIRRPAQGVVIVEPEIERLIHRLGPLLSDPAQITAAHHDLGEGKLKGYDPAEIDALHRAGVADTILVEADGAAGRPLKAHAEHEPVIPGRTGLVVAVIGIDCIGQPLTSDTVHRAERFASLLGLEAGQTVTPAAVAGIVVHPRGYLCRVPPTARVAVLLNKVDDEEAERQARACAEQLRQADTGQRIERIVMGALRGPSPWLAPLDPPRRRSLSCGRA